MSLWRKANTALAVVILLVMAAMVVAAVRNELRGGSLDDLDAASIKKAVDGG